VRRLVLNVGSRSSHLLMRLCYQSHDLATPVAVLDSTRHPTLGALQVHLCDAEDTRVGDLAAIRQGGKGLLAQIDAGLLAREWHGLDGHIGTREARIPAVRFPANRHRLGCALQARGRDQRTARRPIVESTSKPVSSVAPVPNCLEVKPL
jgi:hypothetical protein